MCLFSKQYMRSARLTYLKEYIYKKKYRNKWNVIGPQLLPKCFHHEKLRHESFAEICYFQWTINLKMFTVVKTRFAYFIIMLKRFKALEKSSKTWTLVKSGLALKKMMLKKQMNKKVLNDFWWDKVKNIFAFIEPIFDIWGSLTSTSYLFS